MQMKKTCLDTYLALCTPLALPDPWRDLRADAFAFQGPLVADTVLTHLLAVHAPEAVIVSGLGRRDSDGNVVLHPELRLPSVQMIALSDPNSGLLHDLITARQSIKHGALPLVAVLDDQVTRCGLATSDGNLLLTPDLMSACILRAAGLPAAPLHGCDQLSRQDMDRLRAFRITCPDYSRRPAAAPSAVPGAEPEVTRDDGDGRPSADVPLRESDTTESLDATGAERTAAADEDPIPTCERDLSLILVNWSPSAPSREPVPAMESFTAFFRSVWDEDYWDPAGTWTPTDSQWRDLTAAIARRDSEALKQFLAECLLLGDAILSVHEGCPELAPELPARDLPTAHRRLREAYARTGSTEDSERFELRREYRAIADETVVQPLVAAAQDTSDVNKRPMQLIYARLIELETQLYLDMTERARSESPRRTSANPLMADYLRLTAQILKTAKELTSWPQPTLAWPIPLRRMASSIPRSTVWASQSNN